MTDAPPHALPPAEQWVAAFAGRLGVDPPTTEEIEVLLELAAVAAHSSERIAAPLACWLAGRVGISPAAALEAAQAVSG